MIRYRVTTEKQGARDRLYDLYEISVFDNFGDRHVFRWSHVAKTGLEGCMYQLISARAKVLTRALNSLSIIPGEITVSKKIEVKEIIFGLPLEDLEKFRFVVVKGGHGKRFGQAKIRKNKCVIIGKLPPSGLRRHRNQIWADWSGNPGGTGSWAAKGGS